MKTLASEDERIAQRIKEIMLQLTGFISSENMAQQTLLTLNQIDVEELWDRSGPKRDGYIDPCEMAREMLEEAMESFIDQLEEYCSLGMIEEAKFYSIGGSAWALFI